MMQVELVCWILNSPKRLTLYSQDAPTEVLTGQSESGRMLAVWISDAGGTKH